MIVLYDYALSLKRRNWFKNASKPAYKVRVRRQEHVVRPERLGRRDCVTRDQLRESHSVRRSSISGGDQDGRRASVAD